MPRRARWRVAQQLVSAPCSARSKKGSCKIVVAHAMPAVKQRGFHMFGLGDEKVESMPTPDNSKKPRKRRTQLEIAEAKEQKGHKLLEEAKAIRDKIDKAEKEKRRKSRLFPVSGILLNIIDDMEFPQGVKDTDFMAALRVMLCAFRRQKGEEKTAFHDRVAPAIDAIFGKKEQRDPAKEAAIKVLTGNPRAADFVSALHKSSKKASSETEK